jgi:sugar phosphate isomerase/epimerase
MRIGISTYTYTWKFGVPGSEPEKPMNIFDLIDKAEKFGLQCIQVADNYLLEKANERLLNGLLEYSGEKNVSLEVGMRGLTPSNILTYLNIAQRLHSPILRVVIDEKNYEPSIDDTISIIKGFINDLKKLNIRLAIENHDRFKAKDFERIVLKTDRDWVGICLDSVNSMGAGEGFETVSEILMPYTINLHVKDFIIFRAPHKMGLVIEGRPAGKGMLNIPELLARLSETGRCQSAILELWTPPESTIEKTISKEEEWAQESISYLKRLS